MPDEKANRFVRVWGEDRVHQTGSVVGSSRGSHEEESGGQQRFHRGRVLLSWALGVRTVIALGVEEQGENEDVGNPVTHDVSV